MWLKGIRQKLKLYKHLNPYIMRKAEWKGPKIILIALLISVNMMFPTMSSLQLIMILDALWYDVSVSSTCTVLEKRAVLLQRAEVRVCAFDIETAKLLLKFPEAEYDSIMMISYMIDGQGYLIINRVFVGEDIEDLEYTPKLEFEGYFKVKNTKDEEELLKVWFDHMQEVKPGIYVTYIGDFFEWPFLEKRAVHHGIKMINILWISDDGIPDLGGISEADTCFADEVRQPALSYPGA